MEPAGPVSQPGAEGGCLSPAAGDRLREAAEGAERRGGAAAPGPARCRLRACLRGIEKLLSQSLTGMHDKASCQKGQDWAHSNYGRGILVSLVTRLRILCDLLFTTSNSHSLI